MATRQSYYNASNTQSDTSSTSAQDKVAITFTPDANSDYLLLWRGSISDSSTGSDCIAELYDGSSVLATTNIEPKDVTDFATAGGFIRQQFGASPSSTTYTVRWYAEAGTASIKDARVGALKLGANDKYAESLGQSSTTSSSPVTKTSVTFTPSSTGDYVILASAEFTTKSTTQANFINIDVDGTNYGGVEKLYQKDTTNWRSFAAVATVNLDNTSHTITLEHGMFTGGTSYVRNAVIAVLRADDFEANYSAYQGTRQQSNLGTYSTMLTLTATPDNVNHLVLASCTMDHNSSSNSGYVQLTEGGTTDTECLEEPANTNNDLPFFTFYEATLANSSTDWDIDANNESASFITGLDELSIALLQLETSATGTTDSTVAVTESNDTLSASAQVKVSSTVAVTESNDTLSASAQVKVTGSVSVTETDDTLAASATVSDAPIDSTVAVTETDDTLSASAEVLVSSSVAVTETDDTLSASAEVLIDSTIAVTELDDSLTASARVAIASSVAVTETDDTLSASASLRSDSTVNVTETDDTLASSAQVRVTGSVSVTEADDTLSSASAVLIDSSVAVTEDDDTVSAASEVLIDSTVNVTEDDDTLSASAANLINSTVSVTESDDTVSSSAEVLVNATVNVTESDDTLSAAGAVLIDSTVAVTETDDSVSASAAVLVSGSVSVTEDDDTLSADVVGIAVTDSSVNVTEDDDTLSSDSTVVASESNQYVGGWEEKNKSNPLYRPQWSIGKKRFDSFEAAQEYVKSLEEKPLKVRRLGKVTYAGQPVSGYTKLAPLEIFKEASEYEIQALKRAIELQVATQIEEEEIFLLICAAA